MMSTDFRETMLRVINGTWNYKLILKVPDTMRAMIFSIFELLKSENFLHSIKPMEELILCILLR